MVFKLMLVGIIFFFWAWFLIYFLFFSKERKGLLLIISLLTAGFIVPILLVTIYFAQNNALYDLWYVTFIFPFNAATTLVEEDRSQIFLGGIIWFLKSYFPVILLTIVFLLQRAKSLVTDRRKGKTMDFDRKSFLFFGLLFWSLTGFAVILLQRLSWWEYHYSLLMLPLGILAVKGLEDLFEETKNGLFLFRKTPVKILILVAILSFFIPTARRLAKKIYQYNQAEVIRIEGKALQITGSNIDLYKTIASETKFLTKEGQKSSIFVLSNPLYYYLSKISPPIASNGWMPEFFTETEWKRLSREISAEKPGYLIIDNSVDKLIKKRNPNFLNYLNKNYSIYSVNKKNKFYRRKDMPEEGGSLGK